MCAYLHACVRACVRSSVHFPVASLDAQSVHSLGPSLTLIAHAIIARVMLKPSAAKAFSCDLCRQTFTFRKHLVTHEKLPAPVTRSVSLIMACHCLCLMHSGKITEHCSSAGSPCCSSELRVCSESRGSAQPCVSLPILVLVDDHCFGCTHCCISCDVDLQWVLS